MRSRSRSATRRSELSFSCVTFIVLAPVRYWFSASSARSSSLLDAGQLAFEELQRAVAPAGVHRLVMVEVGTGQRVEKASGEARIGVVEADADHTRGGPASSILRLRAMSSYTATGLLATSLKRVPGRASSCRHLQRGRLALDLERHRLTDGAFGQLLIVVVEQHPALGCGMQPHRLAELQARHRRSAPRAASRRPRRSRARTARRTAAAPAQSALRAKRARVPVANARHAAGHAHLEVGARLLDRLGHQVTRAQDLELALDVADRCEVVAVAIAGLPGRHVGHQRSAVRGCRSAPASRRGTPAPPPAGTSAPARARRATPRRTGACAATGGRPATGSPAWPAGGAAPIGGYMLIVGTIGTGDSMGRGAISWRGVFMLYRGSWGKMSTSV